MPRAADRSVAELAGEPWNEGAAELSGEELRLFTAIYRSQFDFVFRNLCRAGVTDAVVEDAVQDVFLVVLRRLSDYRRDTNPKTWLFAILSRVASNYRRREQRKGGLHAISDEQPAPGRGPFQQVAHADDVRLLYRFLDRLSDGRRDVFVMADLEQMTAPEIASQLGINLNTVYSRLRSVREQLADYLADQRMREDS